MTCYIRILVAVTLNLCLILTKLYSNVCFDKRKQVSISVNNTITQCRITHNTEEPQNYSNYKTPGRQSKATSSLYPIKMIAKLDRTQSNVQKMEQTQNPTMGAIISSETTKPLP